jgi:glycosyltransferase involved in cell wall biosynthesis
VSNRELTAIIPVAKMAGKLFNLESLLRKCHSLGIEVVIVHDEQDLDTGIDLERIVKSVNSDLVSVITNTVYSPGKARNLGISRATGDWICFWDSDDNPVPENFLLMLRQAMSQDNKIAVGKFRRTNGDTEEIYGTSETEVGRMPGIWRFAFKRESIQSLTFPGYRMGEDQVFLARVDIPYRDVFRYDEIVYEYVCGDIGQLTKNKKAILELEYAIKDMLALIADSDMKHRIYLIFLSRQILTVLKHGDPILKLKLIKILFEARKLCGDAFGRIFLSEFFISMKKQFKVRGQY